jgi:dTDP-4-amino-4,6-dideoxygalactose transaminase
MKQIPYGRQHITQEDIDAVVEALHSDFLTQGPRIEEFEKAFAKYVGVNTRSRFRMAQRHCTFVHLLLGYSLEAK